MSKAFDTVNRNKLFEGLEYGEEFKTIICIMQGDCLSAILFIFYLACALADHSHTITSIQPPQENQNNATFTVQQKYADELHMPPHRRM